MVSLELDTEGIFTHAIRLPVVPSYFSTSHLSFVFPRVGVKPDVVSVRIRYVTTVGNRLKRRIGDAY